MSSKTFAAATKPEKTRPTNFQAALSNQATAITPDFSPSLVQRARLKPDALTSGEILQLQRTIGNKAVTQLLRQPHDGPVASKTVKSGPTVQRILPPGAKFQTLDTGDAALVAVGDAVVAYNAIGNNRSNSTQFQLCFKRLQAVDRAIYHWFDEVSKNNQRLGMNPHTDEVRTLMTAAEQEHEELIDASKDLKKVLPFDTTGLKGESLKQMQTLWQDIVNSRGKIKLVGSSGYNKRVLAELAKMLSTPTGQAMLQFLNTPKTGEIIGSPQAALSNIYIGEKITDLPQEVQDASPELENRNRAEAQPLNISASDPTRTLEALTEVKESDVVEGDEPDEEDFPDVDQTDLSKVRTAAIGGKKGFTHKDKQYDFNDKGTGAFVTSFGDKSIHPSKGTGNEILTPAWVTMGHELGHAVNMRAGATTLKTKGTLMDSLTGNAKNSDEWDNTEELLNIENVENALRSESGQSERHGHRPPAWLLKEGLETKKRIRKPLLDLHAIDNSWYNDTEWKALYDKIGKTPAKKMIEAEVVEDYEDEVANFLPNKVTTLLPGYLTQISSEQAKANTLLTGLTSAKDKADALVFLHKNVAKFPAIKKKLHYGFFGRIPNKKAGRKQSRVVMFKRIITEQVTI